MSTETELNPGVDNFPGPIEDHLSRSVMAKAAWGQRSLSPWVQRQLDSGRGSGEATSGRSPIALTLSGTRSLLGRLQRAADDSRVWQPNVGSLNPLLVNNFTETIVHRFQDTGAKAAPDPIGDSLVDQTELPLAGVKSETASEPVVQRQAPALPFTLEEVRRALESPGSGGRREAPSPAQAPAAGAKAAPVQRQPAGPAGPLPFSLAEVRAALEKPHFTQASERPVQRTADQPTASPGQPDRTIPPRRRVLSRVEEVTPTTGEPSGETGIPEPTENQSGALPSLDIPPAPSQIQRQPERAKSLRGPAETPPDRAYPSVGMPGTQTQEPSETPEAPPVAPTVVEVIPFPTRPRRERPTIIPAVQRQAAEKNAAPETPSSNQPGQGSAQTKAETAPPGQTSPGETSRAGERSSSQVTIPANLKNEEIIQRQPEVDTPQLISSAAPELAEILPSQLQAAPTQTGSGSENEPMIQRQPELDLPLREPASSSTQAEIPTNPLEAPNIQPQVESGTTTGGSQQLTASPGQPPVLQRQPEVPTGEKPLQQTVLPSAPAETPPAQAIPTQPQRETGTGASSQQPTLQRHSDMPAEDIGLEMPLREAASPPTPAEVPASPPPAQAEETSSQQLQREAEPGVSSQPPTAKIHLPVEPALQRQLDLPTEEIPLEMPLRETTSPTQGEETPSIQRHPDLSSETEETSLIQPQREAEPGASSQQSMAKVELPVEPAVQRQPGTPAGDIGLEMPLRETASPSAPVETPAAAPAQGEETPSIQRHPDLSPQAEETSSGQLQREAGVGPSSGQPPTAKIEPPVQPALQRQPGLPAEDHPLEMPLREAALPSAPATLPAQGEETSSVQRHLDLSPEAEESSSVQLQREAGVGPSSSQPPTAKIEPPVQPALQRQPDVPAGSLPLEMPLREPTPASTSTETLPVPPAQTEKASSVQTQREVEAGVSSSSQQPAANIEPPVEPVLQRQLDLPAGDLPLEMPLRQTASPSTPVETGLASPIESAEHFLEQSAGAGTPALERPSSPGSRLVQRQPDSAPDQVRLDMPLREAAPPDQPADVSPPAATSETALQRLPDLLAGDSQLEMPLREPGSTPTSVEERGEQEAAPEAALSPGPVQQPVGSGQRVQTQVQRQSDQPLELPLRQPRAASETTAAETDLSQNILSKARTRLDLPLVKPSSGSTGLIQSKSAGPMAALPQARFENELDAPTRTEAEPPPLAMPYRVEPAGSSSETAAVSSPPPPVGPAVVQRQPATSGPIFQSSEAASPASDIVQRGETETTPVTTSTTNNSAPAAPGTSGVELERLARQILPEIKRLLARERDRQSR